MPSQTWWNSDQSRATKLWYPLEGVDVVELAGDKGDCKGCVETYVGRGFYI